MGYSHYYYQKRDFTPVEWVSIISAAQRAIDLAAQKEIRICDGLGEGYRPTLGSGAICLNGDAFRDEDYETFVLYRVKPANPSWRKDDPEYFAFCKTARKPYDFVVVRILAAARKIAPDAIRISSDGGNEVFEGLD